MSAGPLRIGLPVDNAYRDLPGVVLTAMRLCQDGCTCLLIPRDGLRELWILAPDFVIIDNLRKGAGGLLNRIARAGIGVGILDTEGGIFPDLDAYFAQITTNASILCTISGFYSWGPRLADRIVSEGRLTKEQVTLTGTPRMDFHVEPWRSAMLRLNPLPQEVRRPFILLNGTFNVINPSHKDLDKVRGEYAASGHEFEALRGWFETQRRAMRQFIDLTRSLAARLPGLDFVYRPHPFEAPDTYSTCFDGIPNVRVVKQGTVEAWIYRACAVIHCGSSTAIDAALASIPAFSPAWIGTHLRLPSVEAVSVACASEEELEGHLRAAAAGNLACQPAARKALDGIISDWYYVVDGRSHDRLARAILQSCGGGSRISLSYCRRFLDGAGSLRPPLTRRVRHLVCRAFNLPVFWSFKHMRQEPPVVTCDHSVSFDLDQVRSAVAALEPAARDVYGSSWRAVNVRSANENGEYHFGYTKGRSVVLKAG